jgi:hypothetical protein
MPKTPQSVGLIIGKAPRSYLIELLEAADSLCGYMQAFLEALKQSKCPRCNGSGCAPYVGGDIDDDPCPTCDGTGFNQELGTISADGHAFELAKALV